MLRPSLFLLICFCSSTLSAQTRPCDRATYNEFITIGQGHFDNGDYIQAFQYYNSAKDYCPQKGEEVEGLIEGIIAKIAADQQETENALSQANKLIDAFYFYADRFALAYGEKDYNNVFYFIDKNGDEVKRLGQWGKAEQFDDTGFAKVIKFGTDYLLDTLGEAYPVAYNLADLDERKTAIDLRDIRWDSFPRLILDYPQLKVVILNGTPKSKNSLSIPSLIDRLQQLHVLQLSFCGIDSLPESIGQLSNLTTLDLGGNQLRSLPASLGQLSNLRKLGLRLNQLMALPENIGQLSNLTELDLFSIGLAVFPECVLQLSNLTKLHLRRNQLTSLPENLGQLNNLTELDLEENQLATLPESIGQLSKLANLSLYSNELTALPKSMAQLTNLTKLDLGLNQLTSLPENLGQMSNLNNLNLYHNQLTSLPESLSKLSNLTTLILSSNQLTTLPENLGQLSKLKKLYLGSCSFSSEQLNEALLLLQSAPISELYIGNLGLTALPTALTTFINLETLVLSSDPSVNPNKFSPEEIARTKALLPEVSIIH